MFQKHVTISLNTCRLMFQGGIKSRVVAMGWTSGGVLGHPIFDRGCSWDRCKSGEFLRRVKVGTGLELDSPVADLYVNFKVAVLEFTVKVALDSPKKTLDNW